MTEVIKMFTGGFWRYVVAWLLPCAGFLSAIVLTIYPSVKSLPILSSIDAVATSDSTLGALIFGGIVFGASAILALCYEPIYRLWEGYPWPRPLFMAWRSLELKRFKTIARKINTWVEQAQQAKKTRDIDILAYSSTRAALQREALRLFPRYKVDFLPTRLGNGLRAAERYGYERYGLDTQVLWYELGAVAPEPLSQDLDSVRGMVDFFISAATLSCIYTLIAFIVAMVDTSWVLVCYAVVSIVISRLSYLRAARGVGAIAKAQQAIVNVSRGKLADLFGLRLPIDLGDEREMWAAVAAFVLAGDAMGQDTLRPWRKLPSIEQKDNNDGYITVRSGVSHPGRRRPRA